MATALGGQWEQLLDFSQPLDVGLLDSAVHAVYNAATNEERSKAERILTRLKEHEQGWTRADAILEQSSSSESKFFALSILDDVIRYKWSVLPSDEREGMKNYISNIIIKLSSDETTFKNERHFINKLNTILVQVLKHEWPHNWPSFIHDLVGAARNSETLCENCMYILRLLSEEIFDFGRGEMTQQRILELKWSLNKDFQQIHELCEFVLDRTQRVDLVRATLHCLHAYLSWVPLGFIFESNLVDRLLNLFPHPNFRNLVLQCMTEIGALRVEDQYTEKLEKIFWSLMVNLEQMLPANINIPAAFASGGESERGFVLYLAQFFNTFLREHTQLFEGKQGFQELLLNALDYMVKMSYVDSSEVFKVCLEYWQHFVTQIYNQEIEARSARQAGSSMYAFPGAQHAVELANRRQQLYRDILNRVRMLIVTRMAKPEEVIVVEDENGNVIKETLKDNDVIMQHKSMKETLVYLSHLDQKETEELIINRLNSHVSNVPEYNANSLNTLCWAVGAISGTMQDVTEDKFLVSVIRELLSLCESASKKDQKATIASNIMYVVGQYPRFLREHWKFLKTVTNKLFEFMHEPHPGVQDMACETFLKICHSCKRKYVNVERDETQPFLQTIIDNLYDTTKDLEPHQLHLFYEAVGNMASAAQDHQTQEMYLQGLMELPNSKWKNIISQAKQSNASVLREQQTMKDLVNVLQTNTSMCRGIGASFEKQLLNIFTDALEVYRLYSAEIGSIISTRGAIEANSSHVKQMRAVKREVLKLLEAFVERCANAELLVQHIVPGMVEPVLGDYSNNVPDARDSEVLSLFASIVRRIAAKMTAHIPRLLDATFKCTLDMITRNFEDYPDHRLKFYIMLREIVDNCFEAVAQLPEEQHRMLVDAAIWGIKHQERNVADTALNLVYSMVKRFSDSGSANTFLPSHAFTLLSEVFNVMTDTFHKPGFKMQASIIRLFLLSVDSPMLTVPLWDTSTLGPSAYTSNAHFLHSSIINVLCNAFPNMDPAEVRNSVDGMFATKQDFSHFKPLLRDFLVQTRQFKNARDANREMYDEDINTQCQRLEEVLAGPSQQSQRNSQQPQQQA